MSTSLFPRASMPTVEEMFKAVQDALRMFGEYTFSDKGPQEVMEIDGLAERMQRAEAPKAAQLLRSLAHSGPDEGYRRAFSAHAAGAIVLNLQEWDELFEQPGIDELLNNDLPELQPGDEPVGLDTPAPKAARRARPL